MGLTQGLVGIAKASACAPSAGIAELYIANANDITGVTFANTTGDYTIDGVDFASAYFERIHAHNNGIMINVTDERLDNGSARVNIEAEIDILDPDGTKRRALDDIRDVCRLVIAARTWSGKWFMYGIDSYTEVDSDGAETHLYYNGADDNRDRGVEGSTLFVAKFAGTMRELPYIYTGSDDSATTDANKRNYLTTGTP